MINSPKLTVAIPTYDRTIALERTLHVILPQLRTGVEVLIIDNASPVPALPLVERLTGEYNAHGMVRVIRNQCNIGLASNIMRCLEFANGDWVWTLGDDDSPMLGAIDCILNDIDASEPSVAELKYSLLHCCKLAGGAVTNLHQYAKRFEHQGFWHADIFISNSVWRRNTVLPYISSALHWAGTMVPHLVIRVMIIRDGYSVNYRNTEIVHHGGGGTGWSLNRFAKSVPALADIEGAEVFAEEAMPLIAKAFFGGNSWIKGAPGFALKDRRGTGYMTFYLRWAIVSRGLLRLYLILLAIIIPIFRIFPFVNLLVRKRYAQRDDASKVARS